MSLDYLVRGRHVDFETAEQFASTVSDIARQAAANAREIDEQFSSFEKIATYVIDCAERSERMRPSWFGYKAGLAAGIQGDMHRAERFLLGITDQRVIPHATRFLELIAQPDAFTAEINRRVAEQRAALRLEPLIGDVF